MGVVGSWVVYVFIAFIANAACSLYICMLGWKTLGKISNDSQLMKPALKNYTKCIIFRTNEGIYDHLSGPHP